MIEPTESEAVEELDRFCDAMIHIAHEIAKVEQGQWPHHDNPLVNAPHTHQEIVGEWQHSYTREEAVYPMAWVRADKYWPPVKRIDNVHGDRNLQCSCPPVGSYRNG